MVVADDVAVELDASSAPRRSARRGAGGATPPSYDSDEQRLTATTSHEAKVSDDQSFRDAPGNMVRSMEPQNNGRILAAELVGTAGADARRPRRRHPPARARAAARRGRVDRRGLLKLLIIALGFGFSLLVMAYVIGPISGCHINPAVTLGHAPGHARSTASHAVFAWIGQVVGAIGGAAIIYGIASGRDGFNRGQFAANLWSGKYFGLGSAIVVEVRADRAAGDGRAVHHHQEVRRRAWAAWSPASR